MIEFLMNLISSYRFLYWHFLEKYFIIRVICYLPNLFSDFIMIQCVKTEAGENLLCDLILKAYNERNLIKEITCDHCIKMINNISQKQ